MKVWIAAENEDAIQKRGGLNLLSSPCLSFSVIATSIQSLATLLMSD